MKTKVDQTSTKEFLDKFIAILHVNMKYKVQINLQTLNFISL